MAATYVSKEVTALVTTEAMTDKQLMDHARWAESAERYEDMCVFAKVLVERAASEKRELNIDERNVVSVAYKNVVGTKRAAWRSMNAEYEEIDNDLVARYRVVIEKELSAYCGEVIKLMEDYHAAVVKGQNNETEVFYLKMTGDYYRYWAEFASDEDAKKYGTKADEKYEAAAGIAKDALEECHPTRLGLALNWSVCKYEILHQKKEACDLAKKAFDDAIEKLDTLADSQYKDATLIMQLLRDNLTLWTSEDGVDDDE
jgi:hypothetical protein